MDDWGFSWVKEAGCRKAPASDILVENMTARHTGIQERTHARRLCP